ncbi:MAG TPA: WD40 repeat domain-containing protein [Terriglobia bacterium]
MQGSFLTGQSIYADNERIFAASYQGDLFILERNREEGFPLIQTIHLPSPLTAVTGDGNNVYVSSRDGNLYVFSKTWPVQAVRSMSLSQEGLASVALADNKLYVATGQASMAISNDHIYLSELNRGDFGLEVSTMKPYGTQSSTGVTLVFSPGTLQFSGSIPNPPVGQVNINTWLNFIYLTVPGCCGSGITVYDANTMKGIQFIDRPTNTVVGIARRGNPLLVGGSESGAVDLYAFEGTAYNLVSTAALPALTGFNDPEDIEIRALWADGLDNLVIAASSWGNDRSRGPNLPSMFFLEINNNTMQCMHQPCRIAKVN